MITEGRIHPRLQLRQARELLAEFKPALAKKLRNVAIGTTAGQILRVYSITRRQLDAPGS